MATSLSCASLCTPPIGVITAIGPMHLERLGSIEAIAAAKGELLDALPPTVTSSQTPRTPAAWSWRIGQRARDSVRGRAAPPDRSPSRQRPRRPARHPARPSPPPITTPGHRSSRGTYGSPTDARCSPSRWSGPDGPQVEVSAGLLGRHNVSNLLAAAAVGHVLGIPLERIARRARPGASAGAPAAADPQPPRRSGRDRRRLQLQSRRSRRCAWRSCASTRPRDACS